MRILIFLTVLCIAASVEAAKKKPKPAAKEASGYCVSDEDLMAICHAGSAMGKKAKTAMGACAKKMNMTMGMEMRAKKGKGKAKGKGKGKTPKCPNTEAIMEMVEDDYAVEICLFTEMGWIDAEFVSNDDLIVEDIMTLPTEIAEALSGNDYEQCVAKNEKNALGIEKCLKTYTEEEQVALAEAQNGVAHIECFKEMFEKGCSAYMSNTVDSMAGKPDPIWTGIVPEKLSVAPEQFAEIRWPGRLVGANGTVTTGEVTERPRISWEGSEEDLYTVMIVDEGIDVFDLGGAQFVHWLVTNVKSDRLELGTEAMQYVPPFTLSLTADGELNKYGAPHPMLVLVYKQPGRIEVEETQQGCTPSVLTARIQDKDALAAKYDLELVAGTFFWVPYGGRANDDMYCWMTRCARQPAPVLLPGINDKPECAATTEVFDVTLRGPKLAQLAEYNKAISVYNPDSILSTIMDTKDQGLSTGVAREFRSLYGTFGAAPNPEGNLASTLEGEMNVAFLTYNNEEEASKLFVPFDQVAIDFPAIFQAIGYLSPLGYAYHIAVSQPEDQDFDTDSIILAPGSIIWMQLVTVKSGQEETFLELRDKLMNKMINSPYITASYKFDMVRGATAGWGIDNSQTELMMYTARSVQDQQAFLAELLETDQEFLAEFFPTFSCIACTALTGDLLPEYYPPFSV